MDWKDAGSVTVERIDPLPSTAKPVKKTAASSRLTAKSGIEYPTWLPPRFIDASVKNATLRSFMGKFATCTGWEVSYENRIATRRINAKLHHVTPGQTLEALSVHFNTTQRVALEQGKELKQLEAALSETALDTRSDRQKLSDDLKQDLLEQMTPEQKEEYLNGEMVEFPIESMSPEMRQRALQYIQTALSSIEPEKREWLDADESQFNRFRLQLTPKIPGNSVGVIGVSKNGTRIGF